MEAKDVRLGMRVKIVPSSSFYSDYADDILTVRALALEPTDEVSVTLALEGEMFGGSGWSPKEFESVDVGCQPLASTNERRYTDARGDKRTLRGMIAHEPEWVASRFQRLELELEEAYTEMRKVRRGLTAVFDRAVWDRVEGAGHAD